MVLAGWGLIAMAATTNTTIQLTVPDELRGRVMSVYTTIFAGASPIGALFAGALAATAGVAVAMMVGGLLALGAVGVATWLVVRSTAHRDVHGRVAGGRARPRCRVPEAAP